jgi:hypothetical protein
MWLRSQWSRLQRAGQQSLLALAVAALGIAHTPAAPAHQCTKSNRIHDRAGIALGNTHVNVEALAQVPVVLHTPFAAAVEILMQCYSMPLMPFCHSTYNRPSLHTVS